MSVRTDPGGRPRSAFRSAAAASLRGSKPARRGHRRRPAAGWGASAVRPTLVHCSPLPKTRIISACLRRKEHGQPRGSGSSQGHPVKVITRLPCSQRRFSACSYCRGLLGWRTAKCLSCPGVPVPRGAAEGFLVAQRPVPPTLPPCVLPLFQKRDAIRPENGPGKGSLQTGPPRKTVR